jgi:glycosyltransferase involved in cell wall biosynthesis
MALIAMAAYSTAENQKDAQLRKTLQSLWETVDWTKHRLMISVNGSTEETREILRDYEEMIEDVIVNDSNIGTAKAINKVWKLRRSGEHCVKIDDDVVIHHDGWVDEMEEAINREPKIGIIGLKRKDLIECTTHPDTNYRSVLIQLPHKPGERWIVIERARGIMGTCKMINHALLDKIGYLYQPSVYGFDDSMYSCRSDIAGFINCFLPHINIDHIDPGGTNYTTWKQDHAGETFSKANQVINDYISGKRPIYEEA